MRGKPLLWFAVIVGAGLVAVGASANLAGRMLLERPVEGVPCVQRTEPGGVSFLRPGRNANVEMGRTLIRTQTGAPGAGCTRIRWSYRCQVAGPVLVEVRNRDTVLWFEVPPGERAILAGEGGRTVCTLIRPAAA